MAYTGKFIDRVPIICAAGKPCSPHIPSKEMMEEYSQMEKVNALKHDLHIPTEVKELPYKPQRIANSRHRGIHDLFRDETTMKPLTRYQQLITDLKETSYQSDWNKPLGKYHDEVPAFPQGMHPLETTFGKNSTKEQPLYELVLPKEPRYKVLWDSQVNHENYKKTHNDYNVGERVDRNYYKPPYNPNVCAGIQVGYDPRGKKVPCTIKWNTEPIHILSKNHADFLDKHRHKLGQVYTPIGNERCVPKGYTYGAESKKELYGVAELLKPGCKPNLHKRETLDRIKTLNHLRQLIKKRFSPTFTQTDLLSLFIEYDEQFTEFIAIENFYEVIDPLHLRLDHENLELLLEDVGIIQSGKINYYRFMEALNFNMEFEKQLDPLPRENLHYLTESAASYVHHSTDDYDKTPVAGLPTNRYDLKFPPHGGCEVGRDDLPTDDVKMLLDRSLFLQYNISHRDMFQERSKEFIKTLFENCGYQFEKGAFDIIFNMARNQDKTEGVCVDTFYNILKKQSPPFSKHRVDEVDCLLKPCMCK